MAWGQERSDAVAQAYADALLPLAIDADALEAIDAELAAVADLLAAEPQWAELLAAPWCTDDHKCRAVEQALRGRLSDLAVDALLVIVRRGRAALVGQIAAAFRQRVREAEGGVEVEVITAVEMDNPTREIVARGVFEALGRRPTLKTRVDPTIIGGLVLRVGDTITDASIRRQLERLRSAVAGKGRGRFATQGGN